MGTGKPAEKKLAAPGFLGGLALACLILSLLLLFLSAWTYPGGSWADPTARAFDPLANYWCDLMRTEAVNGTPNGTSATLARTAFAALAASLLAFWRVAVTRVGSVRVARWGLLGGTIAACLVALLVVLPYDTRRLSHVITTLAAGGFGFLATTLIFWGSLGSGPLASWRNVWGAGLLVLASWNILVYADQILRDYSESTVLPVVQKLATLLLALWMIATVLDARRDAPARGGRGAPSQ